MFWQNFFWLQNIFAKILGYLIEYDVRRKDDTNYQSIKSFDLHILIKLYILTPSYLNDSFVLYYIA